MNFNMSVNCDLLDVAEIENIADNSDILNEEEEKMLLELEISGTSLSTAGQTARYVEKFRSFLKNNSKNSKFEDVNDETLNDYLRLFYASLRRQDDGKWYAPSTLVCIRAAIHRRLISPEINRNVDILNGR